MPGLSGIEVIPYSIKVTGDFVSVVKFLQTFEHQFFYSEIESFTISSVIGEGGQGGSGAAVRSGSVDASIRAAFYAKVETE